MSQKVQEEKRVGAMLKLFSYRKVRCLALGDNPFFIWMNNKSQTNTICFCSHTFGNQTWETVDSRKPTICEGQQVSPPVWHNIAQNSNLWQIIQLFWCNCPRKAKLCSKYFCKLKSYEMKTKINWGGSVERQLVVSGPINSTDIFFKFCMFAVLHPIICSPAPKYL